MWFVTQLALALIGVPAGALAICVLVAWVGAGDVSAVAALAAARVFGVLPGRRVLNGSVQGNIQPDEGGTGVASQLRRAALAIEAKYVSATGTVNYRAMAASAEFAKYQRAAAMLRQVRLPEIVTWPLQQQTAFWINVYNTLLWCAMIDLRPSTMLQKLEVAQSACFNVGGVPLSLDEIEHGILRCNRPAPSCFWRTIGVRDGVRLQLSLPVSAFDKRIHCALNCGAQGCPRVRVYSADRLHKQLGIAARAFCSTEVSVERHPTGGFPIVRASRIFDWYRSDFSPPRGPGIIASDATLIIVIASLLAPPQSKPGSADALLATELLRATTHPRFVLEFTPYNWNTNGVV